MDKIKTAEQVLKKWYKPLHGIGTLAQIQIEEAMKEYADQFIDLAASKTVDMQYRILDRSGSTDFLNQAIVRYQQTYALSKQSILDIKKLIK